MARPEQRWPVFEADTLDLCLAKAGEDLAQQPPMRCASAFDHCPLHPHSALLPARGDVQAEEPRTHRSWQFAKSTRNVDMSVTMMPIRRGTFTNARAGDRPFVGVRGLRMP
jgi:hypothetical protein